MNSTDLWQQVGLALAAIVAGIGGYLGLKKGDGKEPDSRSPPLNEVKERLRAVEEVVKEILNDLDDHDGRASARYHEIIRQLDRVENSLRIAEAMGHLRRDLTQPPQYIEPPHTRREP